MANNLVKMTLNARDSRLQSLVYDGHKVVGHRDGREIPIGTVSVKNDDSGGKKVKFTGRSNMTLTEMVGDTQISESAIRMARNEVVGNEDLYQDLLRGYSG